MSEELVELCVCQVCGAETNNGLLNAHVRKVHGAEVLNKYVSCPLCVEQVKNKNLHKHFLRTHERGLKKADVDEINKAKVVLGCVDCSDEKNVLISKLMYQCKQCRKKIPLALLRQHLKNKHDFVPSDRFADDVVAEYFFRRVTVEFVRKYKKRDKEGGGCAVVNADSIGVVKRSKSELEIKSSLVAVDGNVSDFVVCEYCGESLKRKNIKRHYMKVHLSDEVVLARNDMNDGGGERGDDIYDRCVKYSGGAYGLGKSRKH